jgi:mRNA-degrading endonuclease RelE of RelBE toxin-antitoxin system
MRMLIALTCYGESGERDSKHWSGKWDGYFRLRAGDFRVIFQITQNAITIARVRHRSEVYR